MEGYVLHLGMPLSVKVYGRADLLQLGKHQEAIASLVHDMNDSTSAEAYCTLGGVVIPGKVASTIGERYGLLPWSMLVTGVPSSG